MHESKILYFIIILPLRRVWPLIWSKLNSLSLWLQYIKFGSGKEDSISFYNFAIIPCWWKVISFIIIWTKLIFLHPWMFCVKSGWNQFSGPSQRERERERERETDRQTCNKTIKLMRPHYWPVSLLVVFQQLSCGLLHPHKPAGHGLVDQWGLGSVQTYTTIMLFNSCCLHTSSFIWCI